MVDRIIYTSGIVFVVLVLAYLQISKNKTFRKIYTRIPLTRLTKRKSSVGMYLSSYALHFKRGTRLKSTLGLLLVTLIFAFIFYNYLFFTVPISNSMRPTFEKGDLVLMQKFDTEPHEGDIIMFGMAIVGGMDKVVTHRIYSVTTDGIKTKGDAVSAVDSWTLRPEQVHAKAVTIGRQPIVIKSVGHYFLDTQISSTYAREFGFLQSLAKGGKQLGLLIFVICIVGYLWLSIDDMKKQKKYRRRN